MSRTWIKLPATGSNLQDDYGESGGSLFKGSNSLYLGVVAMIIVAALFYRLKDLSDRPMHHDEANQAVRCGILQETGVYKYDPLDHHGPSLYYLTLPFTWITSGRDFSGTTIATFRIVPVLFGVGLILLLLPLTDAMGRTAVILSALLTAISPGMVYYSRFFIQEKLLVFFSLALISSFWRYLKSGKAYLAVIAGLSAGMMYATKETCVISWAAMTLGLMAVAAVMPRGDGVVRPSCVRHILFAAVAAAVIVILFFSSFFTNMAGPLDSIKAYSGYLGKGVSTDTGHTHPWDYYITMLGWTKSSGGLVWTEGIINILAAVGFIGAFLPLNNRETHKGFARFIAIYTLAMIVVYSLLSYKTPWCALSFLHGMILLAGMGGAFLLGVGNNAFSKVIIIILLLLGLVHLRTISHRVNGRFAADERNPYAYVHTSRVFMKLVERIEDLSSVHESGKDMFIQVVAPPDKTWPLPWYLRDYSKVGYWTSPEEMVDVPEPAVLITVPEYSELLSTGIENNYISEYHSVRAEVLMSVYIRNDLWNEFMETRK
ncbi:hypothetical protein BVX94_02755 [bacterium B17]|nr:hypothetical protein BVX94_02755 [bacterium B17]